MTRYTDELLEHLRTIADPEPDAVISELITSQQVEVANRILRDLVRNQQTIPTELPDNIENWLRATDKLPDHADSDRLERAAQIYIEHGVTISLILVTASFIECYAAAKGVRVMTTTYRLGQNPYRRVAETAQFLMTVMQPGGLTRDEGEGIAAIQKVRLMHCAVRHYLRQTGQWDAAALGEPICQEDMLGTIMCLSYVVLECLEKLEIHLTAQEAEDYLYLWRIAGEMLGCLPEYLPATVAEARELTLAIRRHAQGPSEEGRAMTKSLLDMHADLIPGEAFDGVVPAIMRFLAGDEVADWLGVPRSHWDAIVRNGPGLAKFFDRLDDSSGPLADLVDRLGLSLLTRKAYAYTDYQRAAFDIPTSLRDAWHFGQDEIA